MVFSNLEFTGRLIHVKSKDANFPAFDALLTLPKSSAAPALIILPGDEGITDFTIDRAELFAEEGWVVIVPNLRWRSSGTSLPTIDKTLLDLDDCAAYLRALPLVGPNHKIGLVGYGTGATQAFLGGCRLDAQFSCIVGYYPEAQKAIHDALATQNTSLPTGPSQSEVFIYPGVHMSFDQNSHASYDSSAANLSHSRTLGHLRKAMGPVFKLEALWDKHCEYEFALRDVNATMSTMVPEPYVNHIPTMTGGVGYNHLSHFYRYHFVNSNPPDTKLIPVSRTVGADRVVDEMIFSFTHTSKIDWMLPGIEPTGKYVEVPLIAIVSFRGELLYNEHIYWDQASVLAQIGLLETKGLPVAGIAQSKKLLDKTLPSNELMGSDWNPIA
ncbi:hypothetical protein HDU76_006163 [Blyttiomyces sp. JEL0837]|nr:hypothetical protein HDU76_006163 [Blyttiomyces sp. JEL0837]